MAGNRVPDVVTRSTRIAAVHATCLGAAFPAPPAPLEPPPPASPPVASPPPPGAPGPPPPGAAARARPGPAAPRLPPFGRPGQRGLPVLPGQGVFRRPGGAAGIRGGYPRQQTTDGWSPVEIPHAWNAT